MMAFSVNVGFRNLIPDIFSRPGTAQWAPMARYLFVCSTVRTFQNIRQRELGTEFVHQKGLPAVALT
jgi:hypothetical protein